MNDPRKDIWQKRKQLGRSKYLILFGLLPWGIGLTVLFSAIEFFSFQEINWIWIPIRLLVFVFIGFSSCVPVTTSGISSSSFSSKSSAGFFSGQKTLSGTFAVTKIEINKILVSINRLESI